jgi:hypothetical protein
MAICAALAGGPPDTARALGSGPAIHTADVYRFFRLYDASGGHPGAEEIQRDYLDTGSPGLKIFARLRNVTGARIAENIRAHPETYSGARRCAAALPRVHKRLKMALKKLVRLYPDARVPPVTIAIGRGKPVGVGGPADGVQIGLEALCSTDYLNPNIEDRFVYVIAHEFVHVQQNPAFVGRDNRTVLEVSLEEGVAEFVGELISGGVSYSHLRALTKGRESEIETAFVADADKTYLSAWLFNGTPQKPGDLGYWVGYRIAKSYYQHASNKRHALREMLEMTSAKAFLAKSGWHPGIQLKATGSVSRL